MLGKRREPSRGCMHRVLKSVRSLLKTLGPSCQPVCVSVCVCDGERESVCVCVSVCACVRKRARSPRKAGATQSLMILPPTVATTDPHVQTKWDPAVGLCLESFGGPRRGGCFLSARNPCTPTTLTVRPNYPFLIFDFP